MLDWYEGWKERNDPYVYVDERIEALNGQLAEYLIAREFAREGVRTYGLEYEKSYNKTKQPLEKENEHRPID
jgi:hypothetical protein